jgi:hypothetical protein
MQTYWCGTLNGGAAYMPLNCSFNSIIQHARTS